MMVGGVMVDKVKNVNKKQTNFEDARLKKMLHHAPQYKPRYAHKNLDHATISI